MSQSKKKPDAKSFYDEFGRKLTNDFVGGNQRMLAAIQFMKTEIANSGAGRVLDIGCGIGWSSNSIASLESVSNVVAVDLSPQLLETANVLFQHSKIRFEQIDITDENLVNQEGVNDSNNVISGRFDAIVMLDVYEHIPLAARELFHKSLDRLLSDDGFLLLTCPTKDHQDYLRKHKPEGLQPVDEDVDLVALEAIARSLDARIDHYSIRTIWNKRDYLHAVIRRNDGGPPEKVIARSGWEKLSARLRGRRAARNARNQA